jgi:hypothetical protein
VNVGRTLFSQIMDFVPWTSFERLVAKCGGDVRVRTLPCTEQFRAMAFAQITYRESLRDLEACLGAQPLKLYGMGFRKAVAKSTLADANERRDWRLWHGLAVICRIPPRPHRASHDATRHAWRTTKKSQRLSPLARILDVS